MISSKGLFFAENVIRDEVTNNISLINLIEEVNASGFPVYLAKVAILAIFERSSHVVEGAKELNLKLHINRTELANTTLRIDFKDKKRNRTIISVNGLAIPHPGVLKAQIYYNNKRISSYTIEVKKIGEKEPAIKIS